MDHPYGNHLVIRPGTTFGSWEIKRVDLWRYNYDAMCLIKSNACEEEFYIPGDFLELWLKEFGVPVDTSNYYPEKIEYN